MVGLVGGLYAYFLVVGLWGWARGGDATTLLGLAIILIILSTLLAGNALVRKFFLLAWRA